MQKKLHNLNYGQQTSFFRGETGYHSSKLMIDIETFVRYIPNA